LMKSDQTENEVEEGADEALTTEAVNDESA
jgi:hypothetical protein